MLDKAKIIKGVHHHKDSQCDMNNDLCPYYCDTNCVKSLLNDVLSLLNEQTKTFNQQPIAHWCDDCGTFIEGDRDGEEGHRTTGEIIDQFWCSWCGFPMYWKSHFCPNCGAKMD